MKKWGEKLGTCFEMLSSTDRAIAVHCWRHDTIRTNTNGNVHKNAVDGRDQNGTYASASVFCSARSMIASLFNDCKTNAQAFYGSFSALSPYTAISSHSSVIDSLVAKIAVEHFE